MDMSEMSATDYEILEYKMLLSGTTDIDMVMRLFAANITRRYSRRCVRKRSCDECGPRGRDCPAKEDLNGIYRTVAATIAHIVTDYCVSDKEPDHA
jgi:hypothetical protein